MDFSPFEDDSKLFQSGFKKFKLDDTLFESK